MEVALELSERGLDGLREMMAAAIGDHDYIHAHVDVSVALLVIEVAKRAPDNPDWFPRGKWATIQAMQEATDRGMGRLFSTDDTGSKV